jgi:hypothetical protein
MRRAACRPPGGKKSALDEIKNGIDGIACDFRRLIFNVPTKHSFLSF